MWRKLKIQLLTQYGLFVIFAIFAVIQLFLIWNGGEAKIFESPDANINYHFATRLASGLPLGIPTTVPVMSEYITPRSALVRGDVIVPAGFIGLVSLYGFLSSFTTTNMIPYWTLVFTLLGFMHFYWLIRKIFSPQMAWWSVLLAMLHPAWLYYTQRSLLPNAFFVSLLMMASYYLYQISQRKRWWDYALIGLTLSAAIAVRPSETAWILAALLVFIIIERRRLFMRYVVMAALWVLPVIVIIALTVMGQWSVVWGGGNQLIQHSTTSILTLTGTLLFPFGFHPRLIWWVTQQYVIWWQLPYLVLAAVGALSLKQNFNEARHRRYGWLTLFVGAFLLCYYGSWVVQDNPVVGSVTIGTSYIRYLLPLYTLLAPYVAWAIIGISRQLLPLYQKLFLGSIVVVLILFSMQRVIGEPQEGWWRQRNDLHIYERTLQRVKAAVPTTAIIMTQRGDKYIWPTFNVLTPQGDDGYLRAAAVLVRSGYQVYWLNPVIDEQRRDYFDQQWQPYGLRLGATIFEQEDIGLYEVVQNYD